MKWIRTQEQSLPDISESVLTIGNFDGLHLGHRKLISQVVTSAQAKGLPSIVCTFRPHPMQIIRPELAGKSTHRLFDYRDQAEVMETLGVDYLVEEKFTKELSLMSAQDFLDLYVVKYFKPSHIIVGYDFSFGNNRAGNFDFLKRYCDLHNIELTQVPAAEKNGQIISSSAIRKLMEHGDVGLAEEYLGRKYYLRGPVRVGHQRGRTLNVPTANISPEIEFVPRKGVYFSKTYIEDKSYYSITNIGVNPTFESNLPSSESILKVETHIFDFDQDIYGQHIKVELNHFHRDEMKFSTIELLKNQIQKDIKEAKKYYNP
jgi:riboflavin kinase/FMN adenylyltransferase